MADGNEYGIVLLKEAGQPVEPVYPDRRHADHLRTNRHLRQQRRIRTLQDCSRPGCTPAKPQQFFVDFTGQYSLHTQVQPKAGRRKLSDIKLMKEDPAGVEAMTEEIKTRYARLFRV